VGNDADIERVPEMVAAEEKIAADQDRDGIAQTLGVAFTIHRSFGEYRSQQPDNEKDAPTSADNIFHQRIQEFLPYHQSPSQTRIAEIHRLIRDSRISRLFDENFIHVMHSYVLPGTVCDPEKQKTSVPALFTAPPPS